jgi:gamma-glutamyl-gamma-aminobutyrate hydrolase PuuD
MNIGLTQRVLYHNKQAYDSIDRNWYDYYKDHTLFCIPNNINQDFKKLASQLDCLVITGGDDSAIRRTTELKIATEMMKLQKPIIGICHGCFLLQDVLGGVIDEIDNHHNTEHDVIYNGESHKVNSYHSLCIKQIHSTGQVLVRDEEGNIEAWIDNNMAGVVWHPERMKSPWLPKEICELYE